MASEFVGRIGFSWILGSRSDLPTLRFTLSITHGCKTQVACSTTTRLTINLRCHLFQYFASGENQVNYGNNKGTPETEIRGV